MVDDLPSATIIRNHQNTTTQRDKEPISYTEGIRLAKWNPPHTVFTRLHEGDESVYNHLIFNIKYHKDTSKAIRIVGFEVEAKSIGWDEPCKNYRPFKMPEAYYMEDRQISFTYEVHFEESKTLWAHRYDHYIKLGDGKVHHL